MTWRDGWACCRCMTTAMIWLSALPNASEGGNTVVIASVCKKSRPVAAPPLCGLSGMPAVRLLNFTALAAVTSLSMKRVAWRALRATSVTPFLLLSSSSSVRMGRKMSCSSKRKRLVGSCIRTLVSSTNSFAADEGLADLLTGGAAWGGERSLRSTMGLLAGDELAYASILARTARSAQAIRHKPWWSCGGFTTALCADNGT